MISSQLLHVDTISEYFTFNLLVNELNWWRSVEKDVIVTVKSHPERVASLWSLVHVTLVEIWLIKFYRYTFNDKSRDYNLPTVSSRYS